ncbi:hypothetical protein GCM10027614_78680 [Micromonospora vulcania]
MAEENLRARLKTLAHGVASAYGVYTARQRLRRVRLKQPAAVLSARPLRSGYLLGAGELAAVAALPTDLAVPGLRRARAKPMPAPVEVPAGGRGVKQLGHAEIGGHAVGLPVVDARQHLHVLGSTGVGKSTFLVNMILDDVAARRGVVVIDPKETSSPTSWIGYRRPSPTGSSSSIPTRTRAATSTLSRETTTTSPSTTSSRSSARSSKGTGDRASTTPCGSPASP